jgi:hypothetical protein
MPSVFLLALALAAAPEAALTPTPCAAAAGPATMDVKAGARLRSAPDPAARSVAVVDADVSLPVSSRCGAWTEIRWGGFRGWVLAGDVAGPSLERTPHPADPGRVARARNAMRPLGREARLGPWRVVTDAAVGELTGLDAVASNLADAYTARYGVPTGPDPGQTVVIFASDSRYRAFAVADGSPVFQTKGHAGAGLAAFALGQNPLETRVVFVHELTHLLSRNALGDGLPVWLDEGIAEDLAWCRTDTEGRLVPDTLDVHQSSRRDASATSIQRSGPRVSADEWIARAHIGRVPPLAALLAPGSRFFTDPGARRDAATTSVLLVRWCLAERARAARFREFLRAVSLGAPGDLPALAAALGMEPSDVQRDFFAWAKGL